MVNALTWQQTPAIISNQIGNGKYRGSIKFFLTSIKNDKGHLSTSAIVCMARPVLNRFKGCITGMFPQYQNSCKESYEVIKQLTHKA